MSPFMPPVFKAVIVFVVASALVFLAIKIRAGITENTETGHMFSRCLSIIAVFVAIYYGADFFLGYSSYDVYVESMKYLAAVIGTGCYWLGSRK